MTEAQWLSPKPENEIANRMAIAYDEDSRRLAAMKDETEILMTSVEDSYYIDSRIRKLIRALLERQDKINYDLEIELEQTKIFLEDMGVYVD